MGNSISLIKNFNAVTFFSVASPQLARAAETPQTQERRREPGFNRPKYLPFTGKLEFDEKAPAITHREEEIKLYYLPRPSDGKLVVVKREANKYVFVADQKELDDVVVPAVKKTIDTRLDIGPRRRKFTMNPEFDAKASAIEYKGKTVETLFMNTNGAWRVIRRVDGQWSIASANEMQAILDAEKAEIDKIVAREQGNPAKK